MKLEDMLQTSVWTFAYPFTEITHSLKSLVQSVHFISRGGNLDKFYMKNEETPDYANISSQVALSNFKFSVYENWIKNNIRLKSWTVFQLHGIRRRPTGLATYIEKYI